MSMFILAISCLATSNLPCEEGNGKPLQYSCLENSTDRGAWWARVQGVTKESGHNLATQQQQQPSEAEIQRCTVGTVSRGKEN